MKKRIVSVLLCAAMVMTMFTACGSKKEATTNDDANVEDTTTDDGAATDETATIPEAKYYFSFDGTDGGAVVKENDFTSEGAVTVDTRIIDSASTLLYADGVKGQCAYFDGSYGLELPVEPVGDTYTISFWMNAARFSDYGPVLTYGSDFYSENASAKWVNFTKTSWTEDTFPTIWSRDEAADIWPWFDAQDGQVFGKKEWVQITMVSDETVKTADGIFINAKLYVNGELQTKTDAEGNLLENQLTPGVFGEADSFHFLLGINCWDTIFKGAIDELYVYDKALTEAEVKALYADGDGSVELVAPESVTVEDEPTAIVLPEITADASAVETVGAITRDAAFWSAFSNAVEVNDGETKTITFNNYSDCAANWDNYVVAITNTATTSDLAPSADNYAGYAEYAVVRADLFGWGDASYAGTFEGSWGDDWEAFANMMSAAKVTLAVSRSGADVTLNATILGSDGVEYTSTSVITSTLAADAPCYFFLTGEKVYIEVLSVE